MIRAVQAVVRTQQVGPTRAAAGHASADTNDGKIAEPPRLRDAGLDRCAPESDEVGHVAPVQRQFHNPLVLDDLADTRAARLHQRGVGFHRDLFTHRADLERDVDSRVCIHLQRHSRLNRRGEPGFGDLQTIRSNRKGGQHVAAIGSAGGCACCAGIGLRRFDVGTGYGRTAGVANRSVNLGCGLCPSGN